MATSLPLYAPYNERYASHSNPRGPEYGQSYCPRYGGHAYLDRGQLNFQQICHKFTERLVPLYKESAWHSAGPIIYMKIVMLFSFFTLLAAPASYGRELNESFLLRAEARAYAAEAAETKLLASDSACGHCSSCEQECGVECTDCAGQC